MKKKNLTIVTIALAFVSFVYLVSCKKDEPTTQPTPCDAKGSYSGTYTNYLNQSASMAYILTDDNFAKGAANLSSSPTAWGSYSNTCDSVKIRSWNSTNGNYYYFAGKFSNNRTTINGIYKNLTTTTETGTFTLTKQ